MGNRTFSAHLMRSIVLLLAVAVQFAWSVAADENISINVAQTGKKEFRLDVTLFLEEAATLKVVKIPPFIDASRINSSLPVTANKRSILSVPISYTGQGIDTLWLQVSKRDTIKSFYLVFDVYSDSPSTELKKIITEPISLWKNSGENEAVFQIEAKAAKVTNSVESLLSKSEVMKSTSLVSGVTYAGCTNELGANPSTIDPAAWGVKYQKNQISRVATFSKTGEKAKVERKVSRDNDSTKPADSDKSDQRSRSDSSGNNSSNNQTDSTSTKPENEEPVAGPFVFQTNPVSIPGLAPRTNWSQAEGTSQGGPFGETRILIPGLKRRPKRVDSVELVVTMAPIGSGYGDARIRMSMRPTLPMTQRHPGGSWYAPKQNTMGTQLGEYSVTAGEKVLRFELPRRLLTNPRRELYVSVLNLSNVILDIIDVKIEIKGEY